MEADAALRVAQRPVVVVVNPAATRARHAVAPWAVALGVALAEVEAVDTATTTRSHPVKMPIWAPMAATACLRAAAPAQRASLIQCAPALTAWPSVDVAVAASAAAVAVAVAVEAATPVDAEARVALAAAPVVVALTAANPEKCPASGCTVTLLAHGHSASGGAIHRLTQAIYLAWVFSCSHSAEGKSPTGYPQMEYW